jgi:hypothetical protein
VREGVSRLHAWLRESIRPPRLPVQEEAAT